MAHFAELDKDNVVLRVLVIDNDKTYDEDGIEREELGVAFCKELFGADTNWVQTSFNTSKRGHFASVGYTYDKKLDAFIPPKPHAAFVFDKATLSWQPPHAEPEFDYATQRCYWSDETNDWVVENREVPLAIE